MFGGAALAQVFIAQLLQNRGRNDLVSGRHAGCREEKEEFVVADRRRVVKMLANMRESDYLESCWFRGKGLGRYER